MYEFSIKNRKILTSYVKNKITEYLGFNVDLIYESADFAFIFGGAIRDSINNDHINDIDILCLSQSSYKVDQLLTQYGYVWEEEYIKKDFIELYKGIKIVNEPRTFVKNDRKVQIITPITTIHDNPYTKFQEILHNVDLSCCGVYYDGNYVKESVNKAIMTIIRKEFYQVPDAKMVNEDRIDRRIGKMLGRGWNKIDPSQYFFDTGIPEEDINELVKVIEREVTIDEVLM